MMKAFINLCLRQINMSQITTIHGTFEWVLKTIDEDGNDVIVLQEVLS